MSNGAKKRFIELLEEEADQAHKMALAWRELREKHGAYRLENLDQVPIATPEEMVMKFTMREKELRASIAKIRPM